MDWRAPSYDSLLSEDSESVKDENSPPFQIKRRPKWHFNFSIVLPWILCVILSALLVMTQILHKIPRIHDTFEAGFDTEFAFSNETMGLKRVRFTSDIQVDPNGTLYLSQNPNGPQYVGPPTPEIDQAWEDLLMKNDRYVGLTPEEVAQKTNFKPEKEDWILDRYWIEPNGLHSLHCLNMLRKYSYHNHYPEIQDLPPSPFRITDRLHLDHCIDAIRQNLLCSLDLTPTIRSWRPEAGFYLSRIEQWHTCRIVEPINSWLQWRGENFTGDDFKNASQRFRDPNALYAKYYP